MNTLRLCEYPAFNQVRTLELDDEIFFSIADFIEALEISKSSETFSTSGEALETRADAFRMLADAYWKHKESAVATIQAVRDHFCNHTYFDSVIWNLSCCVMECVVAQNHLDEFDIHELFKENYSKVGSGTIVDRKSDPHHKPDAWVMVDDEYIPVEIKLGNFNQSSVGQIDRYVKFYDATQGIAVGEKLTATLPSYIKFISIDDLRKAKEYNKT